MTTLIEALNYRCLRYLSRPLGPFHVLVGPNASGKTTFLDVVGFLHDIVTQGLDYALTERTSNPEELLFRREGERFELAIEAIIPDSRRILTAKPEYDTARYEVSIGFDETRRQFEFKGEKFLLKKQTRVQLPQRDLFPERIAGAKSLLTTGGKRDQKVVVNKKPGGNDNFYSEAQKSGKVWAPSFKLGSLKSALGNLPADESAFPVAIWFLDFLGSGVQQFVLDSLKIRKPSPPTRVKGFLPDGSNLPWVIDRMQNEHRDKYEAWIAHLQTALPDLRGISTIERPEDKHRYMVYEYNGGFKVPSWLVSDGTLRLSALTIPPYLANMKGMYLIEEPENGIHPRAVATVYDSLSSVYSAQVLLASHSPVVLNAAKINEVLCFAKTEDGSTDIVLGSDHPKLRAWRGQVNLGTMLAAGVLG